jgi:folate-binding protein YgfZ
VIPDGGLGEMNAVTTLAGAETIEIADRAVPQHYGDPAEEYLAARRGAAVILRNHEGIVRALGRDRLDLLHRMSTNDLTGMEVGEARPTVLTTALARIVDQVWILNLSETALCLTSPGKADAIRRWLAGYIFYRDQVKLEDASSALVRLAICGPHASEAADALLPGAASLKTKRFIQQDDVIGLRARPLAGDGFTIIASIERVEALWAQAIAAGATPAGEAAYQLLRLADGRPYVGHELTEEYIPLEAGLWEAVSFSKGCYIGQEIIARMESRGKLARRLAGLRLAAPVSEGSGVHVGESLAGSVTTAGVLPDLGPVALAYLRTAHAEPGTSVTVGGIDGKVVNLPFVA